MALVKTTALAKRKAEMSKAPPATVDPGKPTSPRTPKVTAEARAPVSREQAAERVAAATMQLSSSIDEAAAASEQLRRALEQIASGAEEAAGAAQQSLATVAELSRQFGKARTEADASRKRAEGLQVAMGESAAMIEGSLLAVAANATRQLATVDLINRLQSQAEGIGQSTMIVADVSDQTNLLALNAAIEAARAGEKGAGFAVVADVVRALADSAERSARDIKALAQSIGDGVSDVSAHIATAALSAKAQGGAGEVVLRDLAAIRAELMALLDGGTVILTAAVEADLAAREAHKGAESVAAAAEQQAAAAAEAQRAVQQQSVALEQSQDAAAALSEIAEGLGAEATSAGPAAMGAAAEALSAMVQELSSAAAEILIAVDQISRGSEAQAAATQQSTAAIAEIERSAGLSTNNAEDAVRRAGAITDLLARSRSGVTDIAGKIQAGLADVRAAVATLSVLDDTARRMERVADRIILLGVQTSMLAVNGAVEAARAGSEGRGFAIVSGDIRKLAEDTSGTIEGAKDGVRSIQNTIAAARRDLETSVEVGEAELARIRLIVERMEDVQRHATGIDSDNKAILASSRDVLVGIREVLVGTEQIAAVAHEAASAASQAASAAHEQSRAAEDLAAAVEEIALLSDELQAGG